MALVLICGHVPYVNYTTVALVLVLLILGVSMRWGWEEAVAASLAGGLCFDYFLVPPRGFGRNSPEQLTTLLAFLCTAIAAGWFAARADRHRSLAEERTAELARLRRLDRVLLESDANAVLERIADQMVEIFGAAGAVFFDPLSGRLFRSGPEATRIAGEWLREAASEVKFFGNAEFSIAVVGVRERGGLGIVGSTLSQRGLGAVAERVGVAVTRARAARLSLEAEVLQRSENLKSAVLDALAHEIKGPFATVKVSVSTLLSGRPGNAEQQRELLEIASEELERIDRWIDDAIRMSSCEAAELRLNRAPHPIGTVVAQALHGLTRELNGRSIEVQVPDSLPCPSFDGEMIEKVIRQLVNNATKYSPLGSPIRIWAEFTGVELVLHVADSGCGISKDDTQRIFQKHYRGGARGSGKQGTGLGLASAKFIMEAHGGEIWVNSVPGSGSVFHISLPVPMEASFEQCENLERR